MKAFWHNDALNLQAENDDERNALAVILAALEKGDLVPESLPGTGPSESN